MNTTKNYLDALRAKTGAPSDYKLAQILGVTRAQISKYRNSYDSFGDEMCLRAASILEVDPAIVLSAVHAERAKSDAERTAWTVIFERLGGLAAAVIIGVGLTATPAPAEASIGAISHNTGENCILCKIKSMSHKVLSN